MQWLIDTIKDWVNAQGFLTTSFIDRGDPAGSDFTDLDLTEDGAWHDLDLSGIVPAGAKAVTIQALITTNASDSKLYLRKNGNVQVHNVSGIFTVVAFELHSADMLVACDTDRKIEYWADGVSVWDFIALTVKGWWL